MITCERLRNGLQVVLKQVPWSQAVAINVLLRVGSRYESPAHQGISHFTEHLLFKGTTHRPTAFHIVNAIERVGGDINAFTSEEYTSYVTLVPLAYFSLGLEVLADMLQNPLLRPRDLRIERSVILEELAKLEDTPEELVYELLSTLMWPDHPLGWSILGKAETLQSITRRDVLRYLATYYIPANTVISIVGNLDPSQAVDAVQRWFGEEASPPPPSFLPAPEKQTAPAVLLRSQQSKETHLCLGIRALPRSHNDLPALLLLNIILAGGMSSRLFQKLRDRSGLAYYIHSEVITFADTGMVVIATGVNAANVEKVIRLILEELRHLKKRRVTERELLDAREHFKGSLILSLEDSASYGEWLGETLLLEGKVPQVTEVLERIEQVSREDILRLARTLFLPERLNLALIGPHTETEAFLRLLDC